jgi:radical SAM protein with 4Fe4S-binding SPASM domain
LDVVEQDLDAYKYLRDIAFQDVIPLGMHVDLTYRCDLACTHCYLAVRQRRELTTSEYADFFAELADLGGFYLLISGGDVFVRPDALDILWKAAEHRFDMTMITHAMAIDDTKADALKAMGVRRVSVSVYHTDSEIHDAVTNRRGSFDRTMAGIHRLLDRSVDVMIKTPVFAVNRGAERVMPAFAELLGVALDMGARIKGGNDGSDDLLALNMDLEAKANVYDRMYATCFSLRNWPSRSSEARTCMAGHASAYLAPDGTVQPCLDYEESAGNIRERSFTEIWQTSALLNRLREIRRKHFTACHSCENYTFCGLCPALAARETGDPTGRAPSRCRESAAVRRMFDRRDAQGPSPGASHVSAKSEAANEAGIATSRGK